MDHGGLSPAGRRSSGRSAAGNARGRIDINNPYPRSQARHQRRVILVPGNTIVTDPEDSCKVVEVKKADVASVKPSNISLMPEKLINECNENEVLDLLAYMLSRGDPNHAMFKK